MPMKRPPTPLERLVGENLTKLMASRQDLNTEKKIAAATIGYPVKVTQTTVGRAKKFHHSAKLDTIEAITHAYGIPAWQLLFPKLDPLSPPIVISGKDKQFYIRFMETMDEFRAENKQEVPSDPNGSVPNSARESNKRRGTRGSKAAPAAKKAASSKSKKAGTAVNKARE